MPHRIPAEGDKQRFPYLDAHEVAATHAEDIVETELPFAAAQQKGVGIKEEDAGEDRHDPAAQRQNGGGRCSAAHTLQHGIVLEENDDIVHHHHAGAGKQVRHIQPLIFADPRDGKPRIKTEFHYAFSPVASRVRVPLIS